MQFGMTTVGLAAATVASGGPKLTLATFKLGSSLAAFSAGHTDIQGSTIYAGPVEGVYPYDNDTCEIRFSVPSSAGPFSFGEVGVYLSTGEMIARAVYTSLQEKVSSVVDGVGSTISYHLLLKLQNVGAAINYNITNYASILKVTGSSVTNPNSYGGSVNAIIAEVTNPNFGATSPVLLTRNTSLLWDPQNYKYIGQFTAAAGSSSTSISNAVFGPGGDQAGNQSSPDYRYLVQSENGQIASVDSNGSGVGTLSHTCAWMTNGTVFHLYDYQGVDNEMFRDPRRMEGVGYDDVSTRIPTTAWYWDHHGVNVYATPVSVLSTTVRGRALHNIAVSNGGTGSVEAPSGLPIGSTFTVVNNTSANDRVWITPGAGVTVALMNESYIGPVSLAKKQVATVWYESATEVRVLVHGAPTLGSIHQFLTDVSPPGYVEPAGQVLLRAEYAIAFALYGTTYNVGGELGTQFRMPDLRSDFLRAWDHGRGVDTGRGVGTFQSDEFKLHGHPFMTGRGNANTDADGGLAMDREGLQEVHPAFTGTIDGDRGNQIGGSGGDETRPRNTAVKMMIYVGY